MTYSVKCRSNDTNKSLTLKPSPHKAGKKKIIKMCRKKLKLLPPTSDGISVKAVLIRNTLRSAQNCPADSESLCEDVECVTCLTEDDARSVPRLLESLLNDIELGQQWRPHHLQQTSQNICNTSTTVTSELLENFHNNEAFCQTKVHFSEDPSLLFDIPSSPTNESTDRGH